jgi:hypothetical protein
VVADQPDGGGRPTRQRWLGFGGCRGPLTTRNVLIDDPHPSSLKMPNWSCTLIFDVFLTNSISSNRSRHIV